jgi:hypothetical protein
MNQTAGKLSPTPLRRAWQVDDLGAPLIKGHLPQL